MAMTFTLTATDQLVLEDGTYDAILDSVSPVESTEGDKRTYLRWEFRVAHPDYPNGAKLSANSSTAFSPRSKARKWLQAALARAIEAGEEIEPAAILPLRCRVFVKLDESSGFIRVEDVLKAVAPVRSSVAPALAADTDDVLV